jgi:hypothetical protein
VRIQFEQGLAQLADVDALTVHIVDGPEHEPDPEGTRGRRDRSHAGTPESGNVTQDVDTQPLDWVLVRALLPVSLRIGTLANTCRGAVGVTQVTRALPPARGAIRK